MMKTLKCRSKDEQKINAKKNFVSKKFLKAIKNQSLAIIFWKRLNMTRMKGRKRSNHVSLNEWMTGWKLDTASWQQRKTYCVQCIWYMLSLLYFRWTSPLAPRCWPEVRFCRSVTSNPAIIQPKQLALHFYNLCKWFNKFQYHNSFSSLVKFVLFSAKFHWRPLISLTANKINQILQTNFRNLSSGFGNGVTNPLSVSDIPLQSNFFPFHL